MNTLILLTTLALGLSESIETRLPEDPHMIYTVSFPHNGSKVGLDWKNRHIVPGRTCRKSAKADRAQCQQAAASWLAAECNYYAAKRSLTSKQKDMRDAVCSAMKSVSALASAG